jgi:hypothetical protein
MQDPPYAPPMSDLRDNLRGSIAASSAPYGYTLTVWSCGAVAMQVLGDPAPGEVLLFLAGGSLGFLLVASAAYGGLAADLETPPRKRITLFGTTHVVSAGLAVLAAWGGTSVLDGTAGWPVASFLGTVIFLLVSAIQVTTFSPEDW